MKTIKKGKSHFLLQLFFSHVTFYLNHENTLKQNNLLLLSPSRICQVKICQVKKYHPFFVMLLLLHLLLIFCDVILLLLYGVCVFCDFMFHGVLLFYVWSFVGVLRWSFVSWCNFDCCST